MPDQKSPISQDEADTAVRVLDHIMNNGIHSIPAVQGNKLFQLAKNMAAGRASKNKIHARCYICRRERQYDVQPNAPPLCPQCNSFNTARRAHVAIPNTFAKKTAVVTGGRINLGYAVALVLLRGGASSVIITTRFPDDALRRYTTEPDYDTWSSRLRIVQSEFTSAASIQRTIESIHSLTSGRLDILINNAAQTVPIPGAERDRLLSGETSLIPASQHHIATLDGALTTTTRPDVNSWTAKFNEFSYKELLDVLAINAVVPFILIRECISIMQHNTPAHIINVSSREGMFEPPGQRRFGKHVHTNMAKAALGMMTQTLGEEFKQQQVYINAVDPGYLSHQHSLTHNGADGQVESDVPLTWDDGAARVLNPVIRETPITGAFFKDYRERDWLSGYL